MSQLPTATRRRLRSVTTMAMVLAVAASAPRASACGGFFCQLVPINQAAEQIIFRQDGNQVTAVVLIQYAGDAPDFSWVVPVPGIPELSTGSGLFFQSLELATRPQFTLEVEGAPCPTFALGSPAAPNQGSSEDSDDGVEVLQRSAVGPFEIQVISSQDPQALAQWLEANQYDITSRGAELIAPYLAEGMNFVAVKLLKDQGVGDIQPLIMKYRKPHPTVPIRLTAVAAQPDMGVLVWMLGLGRAVPLNYLHIIPNYTLLNWYQGPLAAYASYQGLITAAMDESGGQGFATDYAGSLAGIREQLPDPQAFLALITELESAENATVFYGSLVFSAALPAAQRLEILRRQLPLQMGVDEFVYQDPSLLLEAVGEGAAQAARDPIVEEIRDGVLTPLQNTLAVFEDDPYLTRLYTTLSADEMTLDPSFSYNDKMPGQGLERKAQLVMGCDVARGSSWSLRLVLGTDRDGQVVLEGTGLPPFSVPAIDQPSVARGEMLDETRDPQLLIDNSAQLERVFIAGDGGGLCGAGAACGAGAGSLLLVGLGGLVLRARRRA